MKLLSHILKLKDMATLLFFGSMMMAWVYLIKYAKKLYNTPPSKIRPRFYSKEEELIWQLESFEEEYIHVDEFLSKDYQVLANIAIEKRMAKKHKQNRRWVRAWIEVFIVAIILLPPSIYSIVLLLAHY